MTCGVAVTVPGGYEHEGAWRRDLWLRPWRGQDEMLLFEQAGFACPAARATALLGRCVSLNRRQPAGRDFARRLTVGDREALLLQLYGLTVRGSLSCVLVCPTCGERMDLELRVADLLTPPGKHEGWEHEVMLEAGGTQYSVTFRLPNGGDQEDGAAEVARNEEQAVGVVLRRCIRSLTCDHGGAEAAIPEGLARELSRVMADLDPQAELWIDTACVACGGPIRSLLDAAHFVLQEAGFGAESLFREIQSLASAFHWREAEILAMSPRRRHKYLELLGGGIRG